MTSEGREKPRHSSPQHSVPGANRLNYRIRKWKNSRPSTPTLLWLRRLGCSLWWRTRRIREHKKVKGMIFKASITFNCRGLKEQMSIWESGRFVCVRQDAMPFLIIKILIFKKIRNKQPLRKWHWNDNYYKKINWKFLSPVFSSPRKHCRGRTRGRGISKEKRGLLIRENDLM